jgi:putative ABC transport system ATP-binding protein
MTVALDDVSKRFHAGTPDERVAIDGVSLRLDDGEFAVVVGSNGAGKSTLLNLVAGPVAPDSGRIAIDGVDVTRWPTHRRADRVARVMQDPMLGTLPTLTVEENLALAEMRARGRGLRPALGRARRERYREVLAGYGLGLEQRLGARVGTLSGGQRQVVSLAMAVLEAPRVLLLDEHTAALDPRTAELVQRATVRAVTGQRLTTLMVTHDMQLALSSGTRLLMMHAGRIVLDARGEELAALTVEGLVKRFHLADDRLLLA